MSDTSAKYGLMLPTQVDPFSTADVRGNFEKIDAAPGTHICTSTTRPTWSSAQAGRRIYETNTGLEWVWGGTAWKRLYGSGLLKKSDGSFAVGTRTTNGFSALTTFVVYISVSGVVVPDGNRPLKIEAWWPGLGNPVGRTAVGIYRSATNASGPLLNWAYWTEDQLANGTGGGAGSLHALEINGLPAGVYNYSLQCRCTGSPGGDNAITMLCDPTAPGTITVTEL